MQNSDKLILDLCGGTGAWSAPYKEAGYDVRVIDPGYGGEDVRLLKVPKEPVYGILAAPPCTMFCLAGNRWKRTNKQMVEALSVVDACLRIVWAVKPVWWALENPVGKLRSWIGVPRMYFHPYDFGDHYSKKTCLWGDFTLPLACPVEPIPPKVKGKPDWHHNCVGKPKGMSVMAWRSITPPGFARAFFEANP